MSMGDYTPRGDAALRGFARQIARLKRDLRILETAAQGAYRSVEEGSVDFYDEDGVLRERVGKQKDGSYGRVTLEGPVPPTPSEPDVVVIDNGVVAITWDGRCEEKWPFAEFRNVRVHLGDTATFTPTKGNQVGTIHAHRGGTIVAVTESDDDNPVYVRLVAVSTAGHTSAPSDAVLVDELDEDDLADEQEEPEWEADDYYVLTAEDVDPALNPTYPNVTFPLTHDPEVESVVAWWRTTPQRPTNYTVNYDAQTITWPLSGFEKADDVLWVHYTYMSPAGDDLPIPLSTDGWRYLPNLPMTDTTDRSSVEFDDSAWAIGSTPFGRSEADGPTTPGWTFWDTQTAIWLRRKIKTSPGADVVVAGSVDNIVDVYWNGVLVLHADHSGSIQQPFTVTIPASSVLAFNVLAIRAQDDATHFPNDGCYINVSVDKA